MIIITTKHKNLYRFLNKQPIFRRLLKYDLSNLDSILDKDLFISIIDSISLSNGTFKTTKSRRFDDIDDILLRLIRPFESITIHDMAVSDGITSFELYEKLFSQKKPFELTISDKYFKLEEYRKFGFKLYYTLDCAFVSSSFISIYANPKLSMLYPISKILGKIARKLKLPSNKRKDISLINPVVKDLIIKQLINSLEVDVFEEGDFDDKYSVVRCMNILNPKYFSVEKLNIAINNIVNSLVEGGVLIVGRTDISTGINHASFYKKNKAGLALIEHSMGGSEISHLLDMS